MAVLQAAWPALGVPQPATSGSAAGPGVEPLWSEAVQAAPGVAGGRGDTSHLAPDQDAEARRLAALVELARGGDAESFGQLYDHYQAPIYRFLFYRVGSVELAEDLTAETFVRALRNMAGFEWQGKDFGAWLTTIARNLSHDHFRAARTRLEQVTGDMTPHDAPTEGPESMVLNQLTTEVLVDRLRGLPTEQRDCLVMRFLQGLSVAETARALDRSEGAVKQLQLRAVRSLASRLPEGLR